MRVVVDSNGLQGDELRTFLAMAPANKAVITDYTAMEAYKDNTLVSTTSRRSCPPVLPPERAAAYRDRPLKSGPTVPHQLSRAKR